MFEQKIEVSKELESFLVEKGVLEQFIHNVEVQLMNTAPFIQSINEAFIWSQTEEGDIFWSILDGEFSN